MARMIIAVLFLFLVAQPAFGADAVPISSPRVVTDGTPSDGDHERAYVTVAVTAAVITSAILYVTRDRPTLNLKPARTRSTRIYVDQNARIGVAFDL